DGERPTLGGAEVRLPARASTRVLLAPPPPLLRRLSRLHQRIPFPGDPSYRSRSSGRPGRALPSPRRGGGVVPGHRGRRRDDRLAQSEQLERVRGHSASADDGRIGREALVTTGRLPAVSIVVPFFNERENVDELHSQIVAAMDAIGTSWEAV